MQVYGIHNSITSAMHNKLFDFTAHILLVFDCYSSQICGSTDAEMLFAAKIHRRLVDFVTRCDWDKSHRKHQEAMSVACRFNSQLVDSYQLYKNRTFLIIPHWCSSSTQHTACTLGISRTCHGRALSVWVTFFQPRKSPEPHTHRQLDLVWFDWCHRMSTFRMQFACFPVFMVVYAL